MIQITTSKATLLIVDLPEGAYDLEVKQMGEFFDKHYILTYKTPIRWDTFQKRNYDWDTRSESKIELIGKTFQLTEEQCAQIVNSFIEIEYPDYGSPFGIVNYPDGDTAKESFHSLLEANKVYKENPYGSKEPDLSDYDIRNASQDYVSSLGVEISLNKDQWQESQSRTMPNSVILKKI